MYFNPMISLQSQIDAYLDSLPVAKRSDMLILHQRIQEWMPGCKLWFLDGKNSEGKVVSNPNIGYGLRTIHYADGSTKEFYQVGISGNTTGISVYIMEIEDKTFLAREFGDRIGKASVTGYCIKFKGLKDIDLGVLGEMVLSVGKGA